MGNLFTYQEIARLLGLNDRRDIENYYREFKQKGNDFLNLLTRKVDLSKYVNIIQRIAIEHPFLTINELYQIFKNKFPSTKMCIASFNKYLSQTNTIAILQNIHKNVSKSNHEWDSQKELLYLLKNHENPIVDKRIEDICNKDKVRANKVKTKRTNLKIENKSLLVKFLVGANINYSIISLILGISKSYVKDLAHRGPSFNNVLQNSIKRYSGKICVDEKYIKLNGNFVYIYSAVDAETGIPLMTELLFTKDVNSWIAFFSKFKKQYGTPKLIISDGYAPLAQGRKAIFPNVSFQYCKFHKIKNFIKKLYENEKDYEKIKIAISKLKQVFSRKTVGGRRKALLELEKMLTGDVKKYFDNKIKKEWKHLTKSLTSNAAERWNKKIKKIVSGKYGLKTPETISLLVNCLWFKELIMNGKIHLDSESTISNLNITELCQEMIPIKQLDQLFERKLNKNAVG